MGKLGWPELLVILLVLVVFFGAKKIPDLARSLGKSLSEFKKGRDEGAKPDAPNDVKKEDPSRKD